MKATIWTLPAVLFVALLMTADQASAGTYYDAVMADNPVGYWRLGETAGTTAYDAMGSNDGAYLNGVTQGTPGAIFGDPDHDTAVRFTGSSVDQQKVDVPYSSDLNPASFSFEVWGKIRPGSTTGHQSPMTSRGGGTGYIFYAEGRNWEFWSGTGGWDELNAPAESAVQGRWTHLVGTYDAATQEKKLYVNGQLAGTKTGVTLSQNTTFPLRFGAGATEGAGQFWFAGDVDEPAVYNYALDINQVVAHYNAARPAKGGELFRAEFDNPGGAGLGPDASNLIFSGQTGAYPTPSNPDGTLVLGGSGTGGMVFTDELPTIINFQNGLVIETEAYYADGATSAGNGFMGLKGLYLHGVGTSGTDRLGGLFAQFQAYPNNTGHIRLGFQSGSPSGGDLWFDSGGVGSQTFTVTGIPDPNGLFTMQLSIYGLGDNDDLVFTVMQDDWSAEISTTIGQYRDNLPSGAIRDTFNEVLTRLRAQPWTMDFGFISTSVREDAYNYLAVFANVPEPSTVALLALGGLGLMGCGWRRRRRDASRAPALSVWLD